MVVIMKQLLRNTQGNKIKKAIIISSMMLFASLFYYYQFPKAGLISTDNAYVQGEISQVSAEVSGIINHVYITDNQYVEAGELLAQIDNRDYLAQYNQAKAGLTMAQAAIANIDERIKLQQISIKQVSTQIDSTMADAIFHRAEWHRLQNLLDKELISQSQFEAQTNKNNQAKAKLAASQLQLSSAKQQLNTLRSDKARLNAQAEQANAALALAKLRLENTQVRAPVAGIIGNRALRAGRFASKGAPLLAIVPVESIWIEANYKETQITNILPGQLVDVLLDSFPEEHLKGRVLSIAPATGAQFGLLPPDNATGNFVKIVQRVPIKIALEIPRALQGRIVPGLSAEVTIDTNH
ncbi:HlyD family secretion protein [Shewanella aegiceratis]|nr:HlyD family secretion protein [Shewanella aegiceratis]